MFTKNSSLQKSFIYKFTKYKFINEILKLPIKLIGRSNDDEFINNDEDTKLFVLESTLPEKAIASENIILSQTFTFLTIKIIRQKKSLSKNSKYFYDKEVLNRALSKKEISFPFLLILINLLNI